MSREIAAIEADCGRPVGSTGLLAVIESAQGITNAVVIAQISPYLMGISLGAEDYVRNLCTKRSPEDIELLFARFPLMPAACAAGIQAFDTVYSDANHEAGFLQ